MRQRLELLQGVVLLALTAGIVVGFGVPADPWLAAAVALFGLGALSHLGAGIGVEGTVAGRDVDGVLLRGAGFCLLGVGIGIVGAAQMRDGDLFGVVVSVAGVFVLGSGIAVLQGKSEFVPDEPAT